MSQAEVHSPAAAGEADLGLQRLDWDSRHFGVSVAQIASPDLDDTSLRRVLSRARDDAIQLVYWFTHVDREGSPALLDEFAGLLVDWKTTFVADLTGVDCSADAADNRGVEVVEWPASAATPDLLALGVSCGIHSRFHADPHLPAGKADDLFRIWTDRSAKREIADVTLVARLPGRPRPAGMVTIAHQEDIGRITLIVVSDDCRRRGVGLSLLGAAHRWIKMHGMNQAIAITQRQNGDACRLYRKAGYQEHLVQRVYHFWPLLARGSS